MVPREPGEFGGEYYRADARGHAEELRRPDRSSVNPDREGPGPEPQLPGLLAAGVRADRRRPLPDQRARGAGDGRLHRHAPEHRRGDQLPHPQRRDPAADGHAERRRHDARGPVDLQALQRRSARSSPATRRSASSTTSSTTRRRSSPARRTGSTSTSARCSGRSRSGRPNKEAGITDYEWIDWYRDHPVEDDLKLLKWSDEQCGGQAHVDW